MPSRKHGRRSKRSRGRYAEQIAKGTKAGTVYTGTVSYRQNVAPCELRFLDPPPGGDAHFATFQITLSSQNPPLLVCLSGQSDHRVAYTRAGDSAAASEPVCCHRVQ